MTTFNPYETTHHGFMYRNPQYETSLPPKMQQPIYSNLKLATIYVRPQIYEGIVTPEVALAQGTAFKSLYRPFVPHKGGKQ